jgi:hypothetical protein
VTKRWDIRQARYVERGDVDAFLLALCQIEREHGFSLGHEDEHGAFVVHLYDGENDLLLGAHIGQTASGGDKS